MSGFSHLNTRLYTLANEGCQMRSVFSASNVLGSLSIKQGFWQCLKSPVMMSSRNLGRWETSRLRKLSQQALLSKEMKAARAVVAKDENRTNPDDRLPPGPIGEVVEILERVRNAARHPLTGSLLGEGGSGLA